MTYYGGKEMAASFRTVRENTLKIAEEIPEDKYDFTPAAECRTIGKTLVHIAMGPGFQYHIHNNKISDLKTVNFPELMKGVIAEEAKSRNKAEIIAFLKSEGDKFASYLEGLDESFLGEQVTMPPGATPATKSRFEMLLGAKEHEMHHRAQLMVMQRMIGQVNHLTRRMQAHFAQATAAPAAR